MVHLQVWLKSRGLPSGGYANMCSCRARPPSCTPTSTPSTRPSSSVTIPSLRGRPVIVGGGVVLAASYEAKACGVRTAMGGGQARAALPARGRRESPHVDAYSEASKAVFEVFRRHDPVRRGAVDRRGVPRRPRARAHRRAAEGDRRAAAARRARARRPADHGRRRADEVPRQGGERRGQAGRPAARAARPRAGVPAPARRSSGCGASARHGAGSCATAASRPSGRWRRSTRTALVAMLGRAVGPPPPRARAQPRPAAGAGGPAAALDRRAARARPRSPQSPAALDAVVVGLVDRLARRLRAARRVCRTVVLRLRFDDFTRATRSHTLIEATAHTQTILATARGLLTAAHAADRRARDHARRRGARQPGRRRRGAARAAVRPRDAVALDAALDDVRERFGSGAITRAVLLGRERG